MIFLKEKELWFFSASSWNDGVAAFREIVGTAVLHALAAGHSAFLNVAAFADGGAGRGGRGSRWCRCCGRGSGGGRGLFVSFLQFVVQEIRRVDSADCQNENESKECKECDFHDKFLLFLF